MVKSVKAEQKADILQSELSKRDVLRLNNQQSNELTRECIDTAMIYLLSEKPYESISISELTKRAGVSRTAFYRNYAAKDDVLKEIGKNVIEGLSAQLSKVNSSDDAHDALVDLFTQIKKQHAYVELLVKANVSIELLFPRSHVLENVIQTTNQEDHYRLVAVDSALEGLIKEWISNNYDLSPEELAKVLELGFTL
ncbi:MAG: TetR/AcrR family transcriptional regulator [Clostridiales bacterium]|nr:TetR/AcrR family transcriptional regulator [Clostridiales bacterium]